MKTVLILNHKIEACGIQQTGRRLYSLAADSDKVNFVYREIDSLREFIAVTRKIRPDTILYNCNNATMPWLTEDIVRDDSATSIFYHHDDYEIRKYYDKYLFLGNDDMLTEGLVPREKRILVPRTLLPPYKGEYKKNKVVTIGSFGFGFWQKGFHTLVKLVNDTFDEAVINLHLTKSYFVDKDGKILNEVSKECMRLNTNPKVELNITHDFKDDDGILEFLAGNDINVFLYNAGGNGGLSGVPDYALAVRRPIAISNYPMFRHIMKDEIRVDKHSLQEILAQGTKPLEEFYENWSNEKYRQRMGEVFSEE